MEQGTAATIGVVNLPPAGMMQLRPAAALGPSPVAQVCPQLDDAHSRSRIDARLAGNAAGA